MSREHSRDLDTLLKLSGQLEATPPLPYPELEALRREFLEQSRGTVSRLVPKEIATLERQHGWAASFNRQMEFFTGTLLRGPETKDAVIGHAEMRRNTPSFGHVLDALKGRPELLTKVQQGFVRLQPVPVRLSPVSFLEPLGNALRHHKAAGTLRSTDDTPLTLNSARPVWMWDGYKGADRTGELVYSPQSFDHDHGGKTKQQMLAEGPQQSAGWQVLLLENLRNIPRAGKGQTIGGRPQVEAGRTPNRYLNLLRTAPYAQEQGLTPEAWLSLFLAHLNETGGEVLDDYASGSACYLTGAYFPSSGYLPCVYWDRVDAQAFVDRVDPGNRFPDDGVRSAVRVV